jgi:protein subunit release factor A
MTSRWRERRLLTGWTDRLQFDSAVFRGRRIPMKTDNSTHLILEVRAAEGGEDAKSLVRLQVAIYSKLANRRSL